MQKKDISVKMHSLPHTNGRITSISKDSIHLVPRHVFVCPITDRDIFCFFCFMFSAFVQEKTRFFSQKNTKNSVYFFPHKVPLFKKNEGKSDKTSVILSVYM